MFYASDSVMDVLGGMLGDAAGCHICACPRSSVAIPTHMEDLMEDIRPPVWRCELAVRRGSARLKCFR